MKTLKRAEQKNVKFNREFYNLNDTRKFIESGVVTVFDKNFKELALTELDFMYDSNNALDEYDLRIFLNITKEIKVVYNKEFGFYHNVVELFNGTQIAIEL